MNNRKLKKNRYIAKIKGNITVPRLVVFRSDKFIYAQLVDDNNKDTLASTSDLGVTDKLTKSERSKEVGRMIAEKAKILKITKVKFDRGGYIYHGRVRALAECARENGLEF